MRLEDMLPDETFGEFTKRENREDLRQVIMRAIEEEREACAKIPEDMAAKWDLSGDSWSASICQQIAKRIRERGQDNG